MCRKYAIRILILIFFLIVNVKTQQSFSATKFDLDSNLPSEELEANLDPKPTEIIKIPEEITIPSTTPTKSTTITTPATTVTTTTALTTTSILSTTTRNEPLPIVPFVSLQQQNLPINVLPTQSVQQRPFKQLPSLLPTLAKNLPVNQNLVHLSQQNIPVQQQLHVVVPQKHTIDSINNRVSNIFSEKAELWFREDYDIRRKIF